MKKSRKKMLISSIAMMLVALVALGTATFAWYANVQEVTAGQNNFKASVSEGLVIKHHSSDANWVTNLTDLDKVAGSLNPASFTYGPFGTAFGVYATANSRDSAMPITGTYSGIKHEAFEASQASGNSYFLIDEMYVASQGTSSKKVDFTVKGAAIEKSYLNVAIYQDDTLLKVFTTDATIAEGQSAAPATRNTSKVEGTYTNPTVSATAQECTVFDGTYQTVQAKLTAQPSSGGGTHIRIVAFVDGFNANCKSASVNTTAVNIDYKFTLSSDQT